MLRLIPCVCLVLSFLSLPSVAQEQPVVVELYTSQGCSSCPPADAYLHKLAARDDVIALALHVDYWDYIGWTDSFGQAAWSVRQRSYAKTAGRTMVYTPQMIINGTDHVVGNRPKDVEALITAHSRVEAEVTLQAVRQDGQVEITIQPQRAMSGSYVLQIVSYLPKETVKITRGENAGRTLSYANIVTGIEQIEDWDGTGALRVTTPFTGDTPAVVLLQAKGHGKIIAAHRVE